MTRRQLLAALLATPTLAIDQDRLLWTPGTRKIFIPNVKQPCPCRMCEIDRQYRRTWKGKFSFAFTRDSYVAHFLTANAT